MSLADKQKWDKKYLEKKELLEARKGSMFIEKYASLCHEKKALDIACGSGRNSIALAHQGFNVDAVDIAALALETLHTRAKAESISERVRTYEVDLDGYSIKNDTYDFMIMTHFLDRELLKKAQEALKPEGIFVVETYMKDASNEKKFSNQDNLLGKEELKTLFNEGFEVLFYDEYLNDSSEMHRMKKQAIVVKKMFS